MKAYVKLGLLVVVLLAGVVVVRFTPLGERLTVDAVLDGLRRLRAQPLAPFLFVAIYIAATALALPGSALTLAGGAVFGFWYAALLNTIGANVGANVAYGLSRALGREGIERIAGTRLQGLNRVTEQHGFFGLLVLRLVPLIPFNLLNFGAGLSGIRWRDYALATVIGILPGTLVYTFFADAIIQGSTRAKLLATGMLIGLSLIPIVARKLGFTMSRRPSREGTP